MARRRSPEERFWDKVSRSAGCWAWMGAINSAGYGTFRVDQTRWALAHRFAYEDLIEDIPEGCDLHHRCGNTFCVRPTHLEPLSRAEHNRITKGGANGRT